ncbi:MAG: hypothetical protein MHMPM18_000410, partial [Marteilia pararefringens]
RNGASIGIDRHREDLIINFNLNLCVLKNRCIEQLLDWILPHDAEQGLGRFLIAFCLGTNN